MTGAPSPWGTPEPWYTGSTSRRDSSSCQRTSAKWLPHQRSGGRCGGGAGSGGGGTGSNAGSWRAIRERYPPQRRTDSAGGVGRGWVPRATPPWGAARRSLVRTSAGAAAVGVPRVEVAVGPGGLHGEGLRAPGARRERDVVQVDVGALVGVLARLRVVPAVLG